MRAYEEGDRIVLETSDKNAYVNWQVDEGQAPWDRLARTPSMAFLAANTDSPLVSTLAVAWGKQAG